MKRVKIVSYGIVFVGLIGGLGYAVAGLVGAVAFPPLFVWLAMSHG